MSAVVNGVTIPGPSAAPNTSVWQQCPDQTWTTGATVDTRDFVGTSGPLSLTNVSVMTHQFSVSLPIR